MTEEQWLTRGQVSRKMEASKEALSNVRSLLQDPHLRRFLEPLEFGRLKHVSEGRHFFEDIEKRVAAACHAQLDHNGKVKPGRGRPLPHGLLTAKEMCAVFIVVAWEFLNDEPPGRYSRRATGAMQVFWLASGGEAGWGNTPSGWGRPLQRALKPSTEADIIGLCRLWRHDMEMAARRGKAPWFPGIIAGLIPA